MKRLVFCQSGFYSRYMQRWHHLGIAASDAGWDVTFVIPTNIWALQRQNSLAGRIPGAGSFRIVNVCHYLPERLCQKALCRFLKNWQWAHKLATYAETFKDAVIVVQDPRFPEEVLGWKRSVLVQDVIDDYLAFYGEDVRENELKIGRAADGIVLTSRNLAVPFAQCNKPTTIIPNGVDFSHYARVSMGAMSEKTVVYMGSLGQWVDFDLLHEVAVELPEWRFKIVGDLRGRTLSRLTWPSNVEFVGVVPYEDLPRLLKGCSVGIIPFRPEDPIVKSTDPLKFYEYLAAGLPVVATRIPDLLRFAKTTGVFFADGAADFSEAIRQAGDLASDAMFRCAAAEVAGANSWTQRWSDFEIFIHAL